MVSIEYDNKQKKHGILTYVINSSTATNDSVKDKSGTNNNDNDSGKS